ncbi:unnamed protein product [Blepharisma stoltei]|uniref:Intraflagellar transport protein 74 homolog n=1 Tax=Blepharisma stoltei TaxID=1481888 RepID=A0AAU9JZ61_9CILI|nr:unnamed protein product [Blepharisma stoltei]
MSGRAPTAYRVPSRQGTGFRGTTGMRGGDASGGASVPDVTVVNRPITNHGLTGIQAQKSGPGRVYYDKSYYLGEIRKKNQELMTEIEKFSNEMEEINRDSNMFKVLEKKREALIKEVRNLEGELADYNLSLDKKRGEAQAEEVLSNYEFMRVQNQRQREMLDSLFLERKGMENQLAAIEHEIATINAQAEERLTELEPDQRQEYVQLQNENKNLEDEIGQKKQLLDNVNQRLVMADAKLRTDVMKQKANHLREQKESLLRRKEDLEVQTNDQNLSFPEAREKLLARVKADNQVIKDIESRTKEVEKGIANYKKQIEEMEQELKTSSDTSHIQKYEILNQRDQEMTQFIESFETTKKNELEMIKTLEDNISNLLEQISRILDRKESMPTQQQVQEWGSDLAFKKGQTANAAATMEMLKRQLAERQADLEKVKNLDQRIPQQLKGIQEKTAQIQEELRTKYNNIEDMRIAAQENLNRLYKTKEYLVNKKDTLSQQLRALTIKLDTKKQQMGDVKFYKELQETESKMTINEQTIFGLKSYIESKGAETNYGPIMNDCMRILEDINNTLLSRYN